jgi:hypothetical protein
MTSATEANNMPRWSGAGLASGASQPILRAFLTPDTVVFDACVLYPASLRDLLLRLAVADLCRARWTEEIQDEVFESLLRDRPDLDPARLSITRRRMCEAVHECLVTGYRRSVPALELPYSASLGPFPDQLRALAMSPTPGKRM